MMRLSRLGTHRSELAECPTWHPGEDALYWTDIGSRQLLRCKPSTGETEVVQDDILVGGLTVQADGSLLLFMDNGTIGHYYGNSITHEVLSIPEVDSRFNDVLVDPEGRVLCGTMPADDEKTGALYKLNLDGTFDCLLERVHVPNGMGLSTDLDSLYVTETNNQLIHSFDYDVSAGTITGRRTFVDFRSVGGKPDGLVVDTEDCVWSAQWGGGVIECYTPLGELAHRIGVPARRVTSATFGGQDRSTLYVTTARDEDSSEQGGYIYQFEPDSSGQEMHNSEVRI